MPVYLSCQDSPTVKNDRFPVKNASFDLVKSLAVKDLAIYIFIYSLYKKRPRHSHRQKSPLTQCQTHFCQNDLFKSLSLKDYSLTSSMSASLSMSRGVVPTLYKSLYAKNQGQPHVKLGKVNLPQVGNATPPPPPSFM
jgi:hypothetical protein